MSSLTPASEAETARGKIFGDVAAWAGNVSTSVAIVFVNKLLMQTFGCHFSTTLVSVSMRTATSQPHTADCALLVWRGATPPPLLWRMSQCVSSTV